MKKTILGSMKTCSTTQSQDGAFPQKTGGSSLCRLKAAMSIKALLSTILLTSPLALAQQANLATGANFNPVRLSTQQLMAGKTGNLKPQTLKTQGAGSASSASATSNSPSSQVKSTKEMKGGSSDGGGYRTFTARQWIQEAAQDLLIQVEFSNEEHLMANPENRKVVLNALRNVEISASVSRRRNGDELLLDYNLSKKRIMVLKSFFDSFTPSTNPDVAIPAIKTLLLHETGHLIGLANDEDAEDFAQGVQQNSFISIAIDAKNPCGTIWQLAPVEGSQYDLKAFSDSYQKICHDGGLDLAFLSYRIGGADHCPLSSALYFMSTSNSSLDAVTFMEQQTLNDAIVQCLKAHRQQ